MILNIALLVGAVAVLLLLLRSVIKSDDNALEWADLISSRDAATGRQYADWNKIGKGGAVVIAIYLPILYANSDRFEPIAGAALLATSLAYLAAVDSYGAWLRSKQGMNQTTTTTEPVDPPGPVKTTVTETTPIAKES